jgi:hypothetical protein
MKVKGDIGGSETEQLYGSHRGRRKGKSSITLRKCRSQQLERHFKLSFQLDILNL